MKRNLLRCSQVNFWKVGSFFKIIFNTTKKSTNFGLELWFSMIKNSWIPWNFLKNVLSYTFVQGRISQITWNQEISWKKFPLWNFFFQNTPNLNKVAVLSRPHHFFFLNFFLCDHSLSLRATHQFIYLRDTPLDFQGVGSFVNFWKFQRIFPLETRVIFFFFFFHPHGEGDFFPP